MDRIFSKPNQLKSFSKKDDGYAADYTTQTNGRKKVVLSNIRPKDINSFQLINEGEIEFWGVNFEKCKANLGTENEICECLFVAKQMNAKKWACFIELKYCLDKERNNKKNSNKAYSQLKSSMITLLEKGILNKKDFKIFLNVSLPNSLNVPFVNFITNPDKIATARDDGYTLYGYNKLRIFNESILLPVKEII